MLSVWGGWNVRGKIPTVRGAEFVLISEPIATEPQTGHAPSLRPARKASNDNRKLTRPASG